MSLVQKFNEDKVIVLQLLPQSCMLGTFGILMPSSDSVTQGLIEFCKTKKVNPWLCFASQILLDVHNTMRYSSMSAFEDLRMFGLRIQKTVDDYFNLSKTHPQPQFWPKEGDEEVKNIHIAVDSWIINDAFLEPRCRSFPKKDAFERHLLLSKHLFDALDEDKEYSPSHHVAEMVAYLGLPPLHFLQRSEETRNVFDEKGTWLGAGGVSIPSVSLEEEEENLEGQNKQLFLQFLRSMLQWVPEERKTAKELLDDPWLNSG